MRSDHQPKVRNRRVFYIPGYDPIPPRRYRELYRTESMQQAKISGYDIDLKPKTSAGLYGWHVQSRIDGAVTDADIDVLLWSDIVRDSMATGIMATYLLLARTAWIYIATGALRRLMWLRKGPVIAALYPVGMLLGQLLLAICVALGIAVLVHNCIIWVADSQLGVIVSSALSRLLFAGSLLPGAFAGWGILKWFKTIDNRLFAYYLMHDYAYSARHNGAYSPELEARMAEFAARIHHALISDVDEVLVVGHSSGAHLAVSIIADLIRAGQVPEHGTALGFLSLGQVVPMVSFLPDAHRLRADLRYLSTREDLTWVDVTAPGDGCSFALCDPVAVSGVAPSGKIWPLVFSAAFTQSLSPARWKALRWRFFRLHFQYLCAFDQPKDYDYFQITAGPMTLGARYAGRVSSRSCIDRAASKYTSVAA
jgi:hypothetical protein